MGPLQKKRQYLFLRYCRELVKNRLARERPNASPGGKLSPPKAVTDEECGRQRLMKEV